MLCVTLGLRLVSSWMYPRVPVGPGLVVAKEKAKEGRQGDQGDERAAGGGGGGGEGGAPF